MFSPPPTSISRRALLAGAGALAVVGVAGCDALSGTQTTTTVTAQAAPAADPLPGLVATTRLHLLRLTAAIAAVPDDAARLTPLRDDRQAHLDALTQEVDRVAGTTSPPAPDSGSADLRLPEDPAAIISTLRGDAATAQVQFTDAMTTVSRYRGALLGSIAACLASHRAVLA
ncbi:hypothetical protein JL107_01105 [Nakamurella flavida]|uniref:Twin-arginine translocation signal domain-containing protein n=1 Tax=Nakamurella flavida TaxID=363630 RepID=A0A938YKC4_9ACTN|nr:hypothetical protein [Nakamurella flavida]MBM9475032.1 hypothetical protein [Nakamurella flavida]MDP9776601.1 hypothetical protein [Nakamurella flavida]